MPRVTLYIRDADASTWERARALAQGSDDSLSSMATEGLEIVVARRERQNSADDANAARMKTCSDGAAVTLADAIESLTAYVETGRPLGHFLHAVLSNDLMGTVSRADESSMANLREIVGHVYMRMPAKCHGSPEIVDAWLAGHPRAGLQFKRHGLGQPNPEAEDDAARARAALAEDHRRHYGYRHDQARREKKR